MVRACSKNPDDLNQDPAVRRAYRRKPGGRLERVEDQEEYSSERNNKGKRPRTSVTEDSRMYPALQYPGIALLICIHRCPTRQRPLDFSSSERAKNEDHDRKPISSEHTILQQYAQTDPHGHAAVCIFCCYAFGLVHSLMTLCSADRHSTIPTPRSRIAPLDLHSSSLRPCPFLIPICLSNAIH